jgi:hypothetical protein
MARKSQLAAKSEFYLSAFMDILMKLERLGDVGGSDGGMGGGSLSEEELEEIELRHWADMKDLQRGFAEAGGFIGLL